MLNLIKVDFRRFSKDKVIKALLIVVLFYAIFVPVGNFILCKATKLPIEPIGRMMFFDSLVPSHGLGIFIPIILTIILVNEYSNGTIRNKLICGYSRTKMFFSSLITILAFGIALYLINSLITLFISSALFGYGVPLTGKEVAGIFYRILLGILIYSTYLTIATFTCHLCKSISAIGVVFVYVIFIGIFASLLVEFENLNGFFTIIMNINPEVQAINIISDVYNSKWVLYGIITSVVLITGVSALGIYILKKTDVK